MRELVGHPAAVDRPGGRDTNVVRLRRKAIRTGQRSAIVADRHVGVQIIPLAYVLEQFGARSPSKQEPRSPFGRVGARIVDRHFVLQRIEISPGEALDLMVLIRMHQPLCVDPGAFVEPHGVHDQRVPLPPAD